MRFKSLLAIVLLLVAVGFFVLNWRVFAAAATVNLLVTSVNAPIGVVMLVLFALILVVLAGYAAIWQSTWLGEFRRQTKELQVQRTLADSAEASRVAELGTLIRSEIANSNQRLEAALEALRAEVRDTERSLAATLGEMDDRSRRGITGPV